MLATAATAKIDVGNHREKPSDLLSAVAHTASSPPERIRINHAIAATTFRGRLVAVRVRLPRPGATIVAPSLSQSSARIAATRRSTSSTLVYGASEIRKPPDSPSPNARAGS